jgi:hypothetical protein
LSTCGDGVGFVAAASPVLGEARELHKGPIMSNTSISPNDTSPSLDPSTLGAATGGQSPLKPIPWAEWNAMAERSGVPTPDSMYDAMSSKDLEWEKTHGGL